MGHGFRQSPIQYDDFAKVELKLGKIVAADLFGSRALFLQLWPKLLDSYAIDALGRDAHGAPPDAVGIKKWLEAAKGARQIAPPCGNRGHTAVRRYSIRCGHGSP